MNLPALTNTNYGITIPENIEPYDIKERVTFETPKIKTYEPTSTSGGDAISTYHNLYEGSCVGINFCSNNTCVNAATAIDIFNFGYCISANIGPNGTKLYRLSSFYYENLDASVVLTLPNFNERWKLTINGVNIPGPYGVPIGIYSSMTVIGNLVTYNTYNLIYING